MVNRLTHATSPYLLQHADNPVDWWEWGEEPFAEARRRDVPVLLSVGYAACQLVQRDMAPRRPRQGTSRQAYLSVILGRIGSSCDADGRPFHDCLYHFLYQH